VISATTHALDYNEKIVTDEVTAQKWIRASDEFDELVFSHKKFIIQFLDEAVAKIPVLSGQCGTALSTLSQGLRDKQLWAYQYLDASALRPSGLANGFVADLGDFDQCLSIDGASQGFDGAYCLVDLKFPLTAKPDRAFLRVSHD
jgi:hypothetical protein